MSTGIRRTTAETTSTAAKETTGTPGTPKTAGKPELVKTLGQIDVTKSFFVYFFWRATVCWSLFCNVAHLYY